MQSQERSYEQGESSVKSYTFILSGESESRRCSFQEMLKIIKERCPHGKMNELLIG